MKLINKTIYNSDDLRAFFKAALEAFGGSPDKTVRVTYSRRGGGLGGWAHLGRAAMHSARSNKDYYARKPHESNSMMIALPGPSYPPPHSLHELAHVFEHELAHNRGLLHGDMAPRVMQWDGKPFPFVTALIASGFKLRRNGPAAEYVYLCRAGHPVISAEQLAANVARYGYNAKTSCAVPVDHPSSWRPHTKPDCPQPKCGCPYLCGERFTIKLLKTPLHLLSASPAERTKARLDAARAARTVQAEKREARLRERLADAEKKLVMAKRRVAALRVKVSYYDRKAAARPGGAKS